MEACFSGPSITLLTAVGLSLQGAIVTIFWQLMKSKNAQIAQAERGQRRAEAKETLWQSVAVRGADDIIPSLVAEVRKDTQSMLRGLSEPLES